MKPAGRWVEVGGTVDAEDHEPMRIGELAEATQTSPRSLRYYEERGLLRARRDANGYRDYGPEALTIVRNIRRLLDVGLTIQDIQPMAACLHHDLAPEPGCDEAIDVHKRRLAVLDERRARLDAVRTRLAGRLDELTVR